MEVVSTALMDQLKVKDRILENISLSVKKVSRTPLVSVSKYCDSITKSISTMLLMTGANMR